MLKVGGVGLNLDTTTDVIIDTVWYNPMTIEQAFARALRLKSIRKFVRLFLYLSAETIEQKVLMFGKMKQEFAKLLLDHNQDPEHFLKETIEKLLAKKAESAGDHSEKTGKRPRVEDAQPSKKPREEVISLEEPNLSIDDLIESSGKERELEFLDTFF